MKNIIMILAFSTTLISVIAQENVGKQVETDATVEVAMDAYAETTLSDVDSSIADAKQFVENYIRENPSYGQSPNWIEKSVSFVKVDSSHRDWSKHRALAYSRAWSELQKLFIQTQNQDIKAEFLSKMYADASGNTPEFTPESYTGSDAIDEFIDKAGAYAFSKLNESLENAGINPEEYSRGSSKQRKKLLEDSIQRETISRSMGKLSGLWPLKTFVTEVNGRYSIGVIGLYKPAFEDIARQVATGKYPLPSNKRNRSPNDNVPQDPAQLINYFGVHPMRDEFGYPALVSFGQWGVSNLHRNPSIAATFKKAALKQARSQADSELAIFLNGAANATDKAYVSELEELFIDVERGGNSTTGDGLSIEDIINQTFSARGRVKLSGLKDLRSWTYLDPKSGQTLVGVARLWTVQNAMDAAAINSPRNLSQNNELPTANDKKDSKKSRSVTQSEELSDPTEF